LSADSPTPLQPASRRALQLAGLLSLLLVAVIVHSLLDQGGESPFNPNPIAAAAERTQEAPGARYSMTATYTSTALPEPMVAHGRGAYNSETERSSATLELNSPLAGEISMEAVGDGTSFYMRGSKITAGLPEGKEWLEVQPFLGQSSQDAMVGGTNANESLQMLSSVSGNVRLVGHEEVRGVPTRRYRAEIGMSEYAQLLSEEGKDELAEEYEKLATLMPQPVVSEVSIDRHELVRRMREVMTLPTEPGKPPVTTDTRIELYDFGAQPDIQLPDSSQVFDATPFLREKLDSIESS
jgi:hypothetical protein